MGAHTGIQFRDGVKYSGNTMFNIIAYYVPEKNNGKKNPDEGCKKKD